MPVCTDVHTSSQMSHRWELARARWAGRRPVLDLAGRGSSLDLGKQGDPGRATRVSRGIANAQRIQFQEGKRGAILPAPAGKARITIRLDDDILEWFRVQADAAGGGSYQTMINEALRNIATEGPAKLETVVRRVVREELKRAGEPRRPRRAKAA